MKSTWGAAPLALIALVACTTDAGETMVSNGGGAPELGVLAHPRGITPIRRGPRNDTPPGCMSNLAYFGGPIISNVEVVQVNWSSAVDSKVQSTLPNFYKAITQSAYFDWLGEYDTAGASAQGGASGTSQHVGRGSFLKSVTITPSNTSKSLTDDDIQKELTAQINAGNLPSPSFDANGEANTIYMIDFPLHYSISQGGASSCVQFCAYHGAITVNGKHVAYGVHPDLSPSSACAGGCGKAADYIDNVTSVHSHELIEAVTDRDVSFVTGTNGPPLAWYADGLGNGCGEIGDICNAQQDTVAGFTVQKEWSNKHNACIAQVANLPLCDGTTRPCKPCTAADNNGGCPAATPVCETDAANVKAGQCVACTGAAQCTTASKPVCEKSKDATTDDTCRGCKADNECAAPNKRCDATSGQCVQCASNADCSGATPACDTKTHTCRACASDSECAMGVCATGASDPNKGKCVQCTQASQCAAPSTCDTKTDTCVQCTSNAQCSNPKPVCGQGDTCVECASDADCNGNAAGPSCLTSGANAGSCGPAPQAGAGGAGGGDGASNDASSSSSGGCSVSRSANGGASLGGLAIGLGLAALARRRRSRR